MNRRQAKEKSPTPWDALIFGLAGILYAIAGVQDYKEIPPTPIEYLGAVNTVFKRGYPYESEIIQVTRFKFAKEIPGDYLHNVVCMKNTYSDVSFGVRPQGEDIVYMVPESIDEYWGQSYKFWCSDVLMSMGN